MNIVLFTEWTQNAVIHRMDAECSYLYELMGFAQDRIIELLVLFHLLISKFFATELFASCVYGLICQYVQWLHNCHP